MTRQKQALLAVPEEDWDDEWLRDLHLFNIVILDARLCAQHGSNGRDAHISFEQFFHTLVGNQRESLSKLLSAYAMQDAAAAFRIAEVSSLDLAGDFSEIVLSNCDQEVFFALLQEQALREISRASLWATLFSEAALRSRVVGVSMWKLPASTEWLQVADGIPRNQRWTGTSYVPDNYYTQALSIATSAQRTLPLVAPLRLVSALTHLPAPGAFRPTELAFKLTSLVIFMGLVVVLGAAVAIPLLRLPPAQLLNHYSVPAAIVIVAGVGWVYFILMRFMLLRAMYRALLLPPVQRNIKDAWSFLHRLLDPEHARGVIAASIEPQSPAKLKGGYPLRMLVGKLMVKGFRELQLARNAL